MLDTDICVYAINHVHNSVLQRLEQAFGHACMSSISFAELSYGAEKSGKLAQNLAAAHAFAKIVPIVEFGTQAAAHYGAIRAALERRGTLVGGNDMLIAAHARSLDLTLVTNNRREFDRIPGLLVENWV